jgi:hypothetical protein
VEMSSHENISVYSLNHCQVICVRVSEDDGGKNARGSDHFSWINKQ